MVQDPRGLTSDSNGDLSVGGVRGFQNSFLVDGTDDNNSFFCAGAGPISRALPVQQRSDPGVPRLLEFLQRGAGTVGRRGVQCGHQVGHEQLARQRILLSARPQIRCAASLMRRNSRTIVSSSSAAPWAGLSAKTGFSSMRGFDQHLLTVPSVVQFANGASTIVPQPGDYDYIDQRHGLCRRTKAERHGRNLSHDDAGQRRLRQGGFQPVAQATRVRAPQHIACLRARTTCSSILPARSLGMPTPQWNGKCAHRKPRRVADQLVDDQAGDQFAACSSRATTSSPLPTPTSRGRRSTTWCRASGGQACCRATPASRSCTLAGTVSYEHGRMHWKFGGDFLQAWIYNYYP